MLIVIEGADGCGKSTQSKRLAAKIGAKHMAFPDRSTPIGKLIDGYLKGEWHAIQPKGATPEDLPLTALVFQALQLANRTEHLLKLERSIMPDVEGWDLVLDRYFASGLVYGKLDGLDPAYLETMHAGLPRPHLNFLLDIPIEVAAMRMAARGTARERYEDVQQLGQLRDLYLTLWQQHCRDDAWVVIDGDRPEDAVAKSLGDYVESWTEAHGR